LWFPTHFRGEVHIVTGQANSERKWNGLHGIGCLDWINWNS